MTSTEGLTATCAAALGLPNLTRTGDCIQVSFVEFEATYIGRDPPIMLIILPIMLCCTAQKFTYYA